MYRDPWPTLTHTLSRQGRGKMFFGLGDLFIEATAHPVAFFNFDHSRLLFSTYLHRLKTARMKSTSGRWLDQIRDDTPDHLSLSFPL
jgi:hypothetical protein